MLVPEPLEHRFSIEGESFLLVEWDRGGEKRIKVDYAMNLTPAPTVLESIDGGNLYAEAVARECLKEAPALFWETRPALANQNGTPARVVTLEHVPRLLWDRFRQEVDAFLAKLFPAVSVDAQPASAAGPGDADAVAPAETLSAGMRGRAE